jgi:hypothetical protein
MLELLEEKIKVKIKDKEYDLVPPTAGALEDLESGIESGKGQVKTVLALVVSLGLPEKVARGLSTGQLKQLIEYVSGTKKN